MENYWKQRCEAAEDLINYIPIPSKEDFSTSEEAAYYKWKELKSQTPSPTGDRDCEELKKENSELRKALEAIINSCNYKDEIEFKHNEEWNMDYWTPAGVMIDTEPFYKAKQLLNL